MAQVHLLLSLLISFSSFTSFAGDSRGNGGDAIVCKDAQGAIKSIELLDYYEAREFYQLKLEVGDPKAEPLEIVRHILTRHRSVDQHRADRYLRRAEQFFKLVHFFDGTLSPIPDALEIGIPKGCELKQLATRNRKAETDPRLKLFVIQKDLWDLLDNVNRAGLILHEIIYEEFLLLKETNSINARSFNGYLASTHFVGMSFLDFREFWKSNYPIRWASFTYQGICYYEVPSYTESYENGLPKRVTLCPDEPAKLPLPNIKAFGGPGKSAWARWDKSEKLTSIEVRYETELLGCPVKGAGRMDFHPGTTQIERLYGKLEPHSTLCFANNRYELDENPQAHWEFSKTGELEKAYLQSTLIKQKDGCEFTFQTGTTMNLDKNGDFRDAYIGYQSRESLICLNGKQLAVVPYSGSFFLFHPASNNTIKYFGVRSPLSFPIHSQSFTATHYVELHSNGKLANVMQTFSTPVKVVDKNNRWILIPKGNYKVDFDLEGRVTYISEWKPR